MVFLPFNTLILALAAPLANQGVAPAPSTLSARPLAPLASSIPLRIMPLGASITYGQASSDGNGYRASLRSQLAAAGAYGSGGPNPINMVGSRQAGTMRDNDVEGWPGNRIEQVHAKAMAAVSVPGLKPNVVLINAGTNDATQNFNVSTAGARMEALIRDVYAASPRAVVILSTLLVNTKAEGNVEHINRQFGDVARKLREKEGRRLVLVDMHGDDGPGTGDLVDGTHPNDAGYRKMANLWYKGLVVASDAGWLQAPEPVQGLPDDGEVKRKGRRGWYA
ncbi:carbohydrate esterase [Staphylotrichum tortipilum]|uniref:Carbohydrate esterase n=1 Tax=Staphylotrichum tortipilum TaxID=2831512 RepID=A0AAN6RQZ8_9PEZI|nr:carbohydrate esterase [Staphylotrichum longicolle]